MMQALQFLKDYDGPISMLMTGVILFLQLWLSSKFASKGDLEALKEAVEGRATATDAKTLDQRLDTLEGGFSLLKNEISHLPTAAAFVATQLEIKEMHGQMNVLIERIKPISATATRLQEFLMDTNGARQAP